jgi:hypothetical protein
VGTGYDKVRTLDALIDRHLAKRLGGVDEYKTQFGNMLHALTDFADWEPNTEVIDRRQEQPIATIGVEDLCEVFYYVAGGPALPQDPFAQRRRGYAISGGCCMVVERVLVGGPAQVRS